MSLPKKTSWTRTVWSSKKGQPLELCCVIASLLSKCIDTAAKRLLSEVLCSLLNLLQLQTCSAGLAPPDLLCNMTLAVFAQLGTTTVHRFASKIRRGIAV